MDDADDIGWWHSKCILSGVASVPFLIKQNPAYSL